MPRCQVLVEVARNDEDRLREHILQAFPVLTVHVQGRPEGPTASGGESAPRAADPGEHARVDHDLADLGVGEPGSHAPGRIGDVIVQSFEWGSRPDRRPALPSFRRSVRFTTEDSAERCSGNQRLMRLGEHVDVCGDTREVLADSCCTALLWQASRHVPIGDPQWLPPLLRLVVLEPVALELQRPAVLGHRAYDVFGCFGGISASISRLTLTFAPTSPTQGALLHSRR